MISGCHICGKPANRSCSLCGLLTCDRHIEEGICSGCKRGRVSEESDEEKRYYDDEEVYH